MGGCSAKIANRGCPTMDEFARAFQKFLGEELPAPLPSIAPWFACPNCGSGSTEIAEHHIKGSTMVCEECNHRWYMKDG